MDYFSYRARLDRKDKRLYDRLYRKISARTGSFEVRASVERIHRALKAMLLDHPELYWFEGKWSGAPKGRRFCMMPKYKELQGDLSAAMVAAQFQGAPIDRIKAAYDWLLANVAYGVSENDQTIYGALQQRRAVCKGIAKTFQLWMNRMGIPSFLAEGTIDGKVSHIWNVVWLDGAFYHVDVAIGYPCFAYLFEGLERNRRYPCFMVSDQTIRQTHRIYDQSLPACPQDYPLDDYIAKALGIPKEWQSPAPKYLDKGSTCVVMKAGSDVIKVAKGAAALAEREMMAGLAEIPGVAKLKESKADGETVYLRMPYYKPLRLRRKEADFDALAMAKDLLGGLIACREKGVYHLDVQPKNIYFDAGGKALLADFGNAAYASELEQLLPRRGTLAFMAPEAYENGDYGQASELYALGLVLYSLLNKAQLPFSDAGAFEAALQRRLGGEAMHQPPDCSDALWQALRKMIAFEKKERFQTYEECLQALENK